MHKSPISQNNIAVTMLQNIFKTNPSQADTELQKPESVGVVMALALVDASFADYCELPQFFQRWSEVCVKIASSINKDFQYTALSCPSPFQQAKGLYYYALAAASQDMKTKEYYLTIAKAAKSPLAVQECNQLLYTKAEQEADPSEQKKLHRTIVQNCKALINEYGTFAYVMLGEAHIRCAKQRMRFEEDPTLSIKATIECLNKAKQYAVVSQEAIQVASLGKGLAASNSLGISSIDELMVNSRSFIDYVYSDTSSSVTLK